uniref:Uncharacterized protein n=1 Tax=Anguilla anguilla TaxID=7936 RepID=A0A0E9UMT0_ANGAN
MCCSTVTVTYNSTKTSLHRDCFGQPHRVN